LDTDLAVAFAGAFAGAADSVLAAAARVAFVADFPPSTTTSAATFPVADRVADFAAAFLSAFSRSTSLANGTFGSLDGVPALTDLETVLAGFAGACCFLVVDDEPVTLRTERRAELSFAIDRAVYRNGTRRSN
jgi:hypothetical protein